MGQLEGFAELKHRITVHAYHRMGETGVLAPEARVESVLRYFTPDRPAVLVKTGKSSYDIVTKYDVVNAVSRASETRE